MMFQCSSGDDFHSWLERCGNIIAACVWTAAVSWLVLPWFASDSQLELLADGYVAAVEALQDIYSVFHESCHNAAEVPFSPFTWYSSCYAHQGFIDCLTSYSHYLMPPILSVFHNFFLRCLSMSLIKHLSLGLVPINLCKASWYSYILVDIPTFFRHTLEMPCCYGGWGASKVSLATLTCLQLVCALLKFSCCCW